MCGRFALAYPKPTIEKYFNIEIPFDFPQRYNIAPTDNCLVLCTEEKIPQMMHWGFLPFWAQGKKMKEQINAQSETIQDKPMFRNAFKEHRCIVVASGFFEWIKEEHDGKISRKPFYISQKDNEPMIFAGIWDRCEREKGVKVGFTILTTDANDAVSKYHTRMPVILDFEKMDLWLNTNAYSSELFELFKPLPAKNLTINEVSPIVNSPKNDSPECLTK